MPSRDDIVARALAENGYHSGEGYDELSKYTQYFGINYGIAYCDIFVSWVYATAGLPLPKMGTWINSGSQYCPESWAYAVSRGATRHPSMAERGDQVIFNWDGNWNPIGPSSHTEIVTGRDGNWLYTIGGNSGPSNVDGYVGTGGVHRHIWDVNNSLIQGTIDMSKLVAFDSHVAEEDWFEVNDAEAKAAFAQINKRIDDSNSQLVTVIEGVPKGVKNPYGLVGIKDLKAELDTIGTLVKHIASHLGVK